MLLNEFLSDRLQAARRWTNALLADIREDNWFVMPEGGIGHVAWQVGHLASSQCILVHHRCMNRPLADVLPENLRMTFARGSTPHPDASKYPPIADIKAMFERTQQECLMMIASLSEKEFDSPAGAEPHPHFVTKAQAIGTAIMHEGFHAGQIAVIRRKLGLKPLR